MIALKGMTKKLLEDAGVGFGEIELEGEIMLVPDDEAAGLKVAEEYDPAFVRYASEEFQGVDIVEVETDTEAEPDVEAEGADDDRLAAVLDDLKDVRDQLKELNEKVDGLMAELDK
jgi:hypothetical protein